MPIILIIGAVIIAAGVGAFVFFSTSTDSTDVRVEDTTPEVTMITEVDEETEDEEELTEESPAPTSEALIPENTPNTSLESTFTASASYLTPRRTEHTVAVTMTVANDVVTAVTVGFDGQPIGQYSNDNQARFDAVYTSEVVGKRLSDVSLSRVGGASLTSQAFNEAVTQISSEAS